MLPFIGGVLMLYTGYKMMRRNKRIATQLPVVADKISSQLRELELQHRLEITALRIRLLEQVERNITLTAAINESGTIEANEAAAFISAVASNPVPDPDMHISLEKQMLTDLMNREERYKAIITRLLEINNWDADNIERVLNFADRPEQIDQDQIDAEH